MTHLGPVFVLITLAVAGTLGLIGAGIEWLAGQFGQKMVPGRLAWLFAADGVGAASVWYWRTTTQTRYSPLALSILFGYIGLEVCKRLGGGWSLWRLNVALSLAVAWLFSGSDSDSESSDVEGIDDRPAPVTDSSDNSSPGT